MGYRNKEIEVKLLIAENNIKYKKAVNIISDIFETSIKREIHDKQADIYWETPMSADADFVRLRVMNSDTGECQLTYKSKRNNNIERVEVDLPVFGKKQARIFVEGLLGPAKGEVTKKYAVFLLDDKEEGTTISVYQIIKPGEQRVFIEVEARSLPEVIKITKKLQNSFPADFLICYSQLFDVFVQDAEMQVEPLFPDQLSVSLTQKTKAASKQFKVE